MFISWSQPGLKISTAACVMSSLMVNQISLGFGPTRAGTELWEINDGQF